MAERIYGSPGTLYQRCGGVFGVSGFVDRLMDRWMANDTLNANQMVARWHESAQRPGFKFLVVQIVCHLTGGPQQYTGRDMAASHKHLGISEEEWGVFMEIFNDVCNEFGLPASDIDDLNALMISMEYDIVVQPGEQPARDPGPWRPSGSSPYARAGGVYPIALFVDRLVDALVNDDRIPVRSVVLSSSLPLTLAGLLTADPHRQQAHARSPQVPRHRVRLQERRRLRDHHSQGLGRDQAPGPRCRVAHRHAHCPARSGPRPGGRSPERVAQGLRE